MIRTLPSLAEIKLWKARKSLAYFTTYTKSDYLMGWVHREICDALDKFLDDVKAKRSPRLIITMPPRSGKSELVSRRFPAYAFGRFPDLQIIATSYSADLSQRFNRDVQRIIDDDKYREIFPETTLNGSRVRPDSRGSYIRTSDLFEIVGHSGAYRSCGVGGGITGQGADCLLIDDPVKDRAEANSATVRQSIWDWYTSTAYTRLSPGGGVIVMATRWHLDDLIGRLIENMGTGQGDNFTVINYPAIAEQDETHRRKGEALHPERYSLDQLRKIQKTVGSRDWAALYQQHPIPDGGNVFKSEWFKYWTESSLPPEFDQIVTSWDMTFKDSKNSDYVVGQVWGKKGADFYLLDQVRGQWDFVKTREMFLILAQKWPKALRKLVEDKANGSAIISELQKTVSGIVPITPKESKEARASAITPFFEAGNVYLPDPKKISWMGAFEAELLNFPAGAHDDQCFVAGTMVATLLGDKPIEKIKAGEMVVTPFGLKRVLFSGKTGTRGVISKFGLTATPEHPFITRKAEIKTFKTVKEEECIKLKYRNLINLILLRRLYSTALPIVSWERESTTLASPQQIKVGKLREDFTSLFGSSFRDKKFLRDFKSIIRMAILSIMNLTILSVYHGANIARKLISKRKELKNIWMRFGRLLAPGIEVKKDVCGTKNTQKNRYERTINACAHIADLFLLPSKSGESFVKEVAKLNIDGNTRAIWSQRNVKFVAKNLQALKEGGVSQEQLVLDPAVESLDGKELPVYNLQIEDAHMFFANGCLVHNCDSLSQALNYFRDHSTYILSKDVLKALKRPPRF